jgi:hypothetical protein
MKKLKENVMYWIKTNLHKDGTPQWDGVVGVKAVNKKIEALRKLGYKPRIDFSVTEQLHLRNL